MEFDNFSNNANLKPSPNGYYILNGKIKVKLTNRIIIKTNPGVVKNQIKNIDKRVTKVTELYKFADSIFYSVTFENTNNLESVLSVFSSLSFVHHFLRFVSRITKSRSGRIAAEGSICNLWSDWITNNACSWWFAICYCYDDRR